MKMFIDTYSIIFLAGLLITAVLGYLFGFGKTLKAMNKGILGKVVAVWFCFTFGGAIASVPFIGGLISEGNAYFGSYSAFLAKLNVATILYYIALFLLASIVKLFIVMIIERIFRKKSKDDGKKVGGKIRDFINRGLGVLLFGAVWLLLVWLVLAFVRELTDIEAIADWVATISSSDNAKIIYGLYEYNPIDLGTLLR